MSARRRIAELEDLVRQFLGLDDWSDELIAPAGLIMRAKLLVPPATEGFVEDVEPHRAAVTGSAQWTGTLKCGQVPHAQAFEEVEKLNGKKHLGYSDWRLPAQGELVSRVDYSRSNPATTDEGVESGFHWSATAFAPYPAVCAWGVYFFLGYGGNFYRDDSGFVRAVRGPVARPGQ